MCYEYPYDTTITPLDTANARIQALEAELATTERKYRTACKVGDELGERLQTANAELAAQREACRIEREKRKLSARLMHPEWEDLMSDQERYQARLYTAEALNLCQQDQINPIARAAVEAKSTTAAPGDG